MRFAAAAEYHIDGSDKYSWLAKIFEEGIENARKNQGDLDERMVV